MHHAQAQYSPRQLLESARRAEVDGNVDLAVHVSRYVVEHFAGSPESSEAYASLIRLGHAPQEIGYADPSLAARGMNGHGSHGTALQAQGSSSYRAQSRPVNGTAIHTASPSQWNGARVDSNGHANGHGNGQLAHLSAPQQPVRPHVPSPLPAPAVVSNAYQGYMQTPVQTIAATFAPAAPYRGASEASPPAVIHHAPEATRQYRGGRTIARLTFTAGWLMMLAGLLSPVPALLGFLGANPSLTGAILVAGALIAGGLLALLGGQTALAVFDQADSMRELVELERTRWDG